MASETKQKKLVMRVHFVDDSFKTVAVPPTITAKDLLSLVAQKTEINATKTFALFYEKNGQTRCLEDNEQPCRLMVYETKEDDVKFAQYTEDKTDWEALKKEWEKENKKIVLKRKVLLKEGGDEDALLYYTYIQAVSDVRSGVIPCSLEEAITLAGVQMQVTFGDHNPKIHTEGFLKDKITRMVPNSLLQTSKQFEEWERDIFAEHSKYNGLSKEEGMKKYMSIVKQWPFFGSTLFQCKRFGTLNTIENLPEKFVLGVNSAGLLILTEGQLQIHTAIKFEDIYGWKFDRTTFKMVFGTETKQHLELSTSFGKDISGTMLSYIRAVADEQRRLAKLQQPAEEAGVSEVLAEPEQTETAQPEQATEVETNQEDE